jgi:DNA-directed RNA polymerase subunit beta
VLLPKGAEIKAEDLDQIPSTYWGDIKVDNDKIEDELSRVVDAMREQRRAHQTHLRGEDRAPEGRRRAPPGVIKMVKVFVAIKRKLQVG